MKNEDILAIIEEKKMLLAKLGRLHFGAPEIRENNSGKYLYANFREGGRKVSKYVGEYTDELYQIMLDDNAEAKKIRKEIKALDAKLAEMGVEADSELSEKVKTAIDFARKNLAVSIQGQAVLEGIATTAAETEEILDGMKIKGISGEDARKILNMKRAWDFILDEFVIISETNFGLMAEINKLVNEGFYYNAGKIRDVPVKIGGTEWKPELPLESQIKENLTEILESKKSRAEKAIDLLLYVMRTQVFIDGNKRTALIFANHYLIANGVGVIFIDPETTDEYKKLLVEFYETGEKGKIREFLKKSLITI